jgi:hypothetical protein
MKVKTLDMRIVFSSDVHPEIFDELMKVRPRARRERVLLLIYRGLALEGLKDIKRSAASEKTEPPRTDDDHEATLGEGGLASAFGFN